MLGGTGITFTGEVHLKGNTVRRFTELSRLLRVSADDRQPRRLLLEWKALIATDNLLVASISGDFVTEQQMQLTELLLYEFRIATMDFEVTGPAEWADAVEGSLLGFYKSFSLPPIYTSLYIFRNKYVIQVPRCWGSWHFLR